MDGPGTLTWEEFLENAESFLAVSNEISDGWELRGDKDIPGQAYLARTAKHFVPRDELAAWNGGSNTGRNTDENSEGFCVELPNDPHEATASECDLPFITEHHILWSMTYGVPVLFFNGWKSDFPGINPVSVNEAQTMFGSQFSYMELSQAIHPIIGGPFLQLHPCLSHELLRSTKTSKNKLVTWLSCIAFAALNLRLHSDYCRLTC